jgi:hypothetical protein
LKVIFLCFVVAVAVLTVLPHNAFSQYITFQGGAKIPEYGNSFIELFYIDESPAPDVISTSSTIKGQPYYSVGASYDHYNKNDLWYYDIGANLYFGELGGLDVGLSGGYPLYLNDTGSIGVIPAVTMGMSYMQKTIGKLVNNTGYIQVNETRFGQGENVDVSLAKFAFFVKPSVAFTMNIAKNYQLRLIGAYMFDAATSGVVNFSGKDNSGKVVSDEEEIDAPNLSYKINGKESKDMPFNLNGFEVRLGLAVNF